MARLKNIAGVIALSMVSAFPVWASEVTVDLSDPLVQITAGFSGTDLLIFGVAPDDGDVVIVVRGPIQSEVVRRKARTFGVWVNRDEVVFDDVPAFYTMASNRPLDEFMPSGIAYVHQIGVENIQMVPRAEYADVEDWEEFRIALIRNKERQNLFKWEPVDLIFLPNRLFRATVRFPANVSVGTFGIDAYLIRKGELAGWETTLLNVRKFGVEASIFSFAHRHSLAYGVIAIIIAALAGWAANAAFRRS